MKGFEPCCAVAEAMAVVRCGLRLDEAVFHMGWTFQVQKFRRGLDSKLNLKSDVERLDALSPRALESQTTEQPLI